MKTIMLAWFCCGCLCVQAGRVSVLNLSDTETVRVELRTGGKLLKMELKPCAESGTLAPEGETTDVVAVYDGKETKVPTPIAGAGSVVVLRVTKDGLASKVLPSKPSAGSLAVRVCNLTSEKVAVRVNSRAVEVPASGEVSVAGVQGRELKWSVADVAEDNYPLEEPCAVIIFLWRVGDAWRGHCFGDY